jgi:transposase
VTEHDALVGYRLRLFSLADELGSVSQACRMMGVHRSTYYRWKRQLDRWGLEALRVRERRRPRMPNEIGPHLEQRIVAFSLAHPGFGPRRISAELAREKWGGIRISEHGIWRVLCRVGLNTRLKRLALIARHRGRLSGSKGSVWQYTAIDVASGYTWAELHSSERNPRSRHCQALLHRLAHELALAGWKLQTVTTDNGSEFASSDSAGSWRPPAPNSAGSKPGDQPPTAASNASSSPSSRNAGDPASPAHSCPSSPPSGATSTSTSPTTTPIAPTPADTPTAASPPTSSTVPARSEQHDDLSRLLGVSAS